MKSILITCLLLAASGTIAMAQCDKKVTLTSSKTQYLDANGTVQQTVDEHDIFEITKAGIKITINGDQIMTGTIGSKACDWQIPFKSGKTVISAQLEDQSGDQKDATLTIEGKDGKVTLLAELKNMPDRKILIAIDKFEETADTGQN
jgi:hypothetical protein